MRLFSYRMFLCAVVALAGFSISACSDLTDRTRIVSHLGTEKATQNQTDSNITNRLARVWMRVARQAMADGDPATAVRFFHKAGDAAPTSARPALGLAEAYGLQGNHDLATEALRTALKIDPWNRNARISLGNMLVAQGKVDEGLDYLNPAQAKTAQPAETGDQTNGDIFSLISELFSSNETGAPESGPSMADAEKPTQKLVIPAAPLRPVARPQYADIAKTLNKIEPAAAPAAEPKTARMKAKAVRAHPAPPNGALAAMPNRARDAKAADQTAPLREKTAFRSPEKTEKTVVSRVQPSAKVQDAAPSATATVPQYKVQLAAYRRLENAARGKTILAKALPSQFPQMEVFVRHSQNGNASRTNYRLRSRTTISRSGANALCRQAASAGFDCLVIRPAPDFWQLVKTRTTASLTRPTPSANPAGTTYPKQSASGQYRIQLAAYRHLKNAIRGRQIITRLLPDGFPGLDILKRSRATKGPAPINFRIRSSSPWPESDARQFCDKARATGVACLLIRHGTKSWKPVSRAAQLQTWPSETRQATALRAQRLNLIATR